MCSVASLGAQNIKISLLAEKFMAKTWLDLLDNILNKGALKSVSWKNLA